MLSGADAKQLYEDKKNILTVKKKKKTPLYIYSIFEKNAREIHISRSTVIFCICFDYRLYEKLGGIYFSD